MKARLIFHGVAILMLLATIAAAQTPGKPKTAPAGRSADSEATSERANGREVSKGMAKGRHLRQPMVIAADKSLGSAHATESLVANTQADKARGGQMQSASANLIYKDSKIASSNPLYESKERQAASSSGASHEVVEYKDPEDMTTHDRPGNNKTSEIKPSTASATSTPPGK
ncbi:MAG TPA: hypothetical protein VK574_07505 [Terracidiphilus sp.]|nr:hypothetical protein [Terracidiphilus sp.]